MLKSVIKLLNIYSAESYTISEKLLVMICLISAAFTFATVMISSFQPCEAAGNVSPIEALRYNETNITAKRDKRTGKVTPLSIAHANMLRSRKKTVVVVLSLTLSLVLVNTLFTILGGIDEEKGDAFQYYHTIFDTYRTVRFDSYEPVFRLVRDFVEYYSSTAISSAVWTSRIDN